MKSPLLVITLGLLSIVAATAAAAAQEGIAIPAPKTQEAAEDNATTATAVFAGGCFWGVQGVFQHAEGVTNAISGYAGGSKEDAAYRTVTTGRTGHAEAVKVTYDPRQISYGKLMQIFFSVAHDPTQLNRQGPDVGPQYRSTIFPENDVQAEQARAYIEQLDAAGAYDAKIVTTIEPGKAFYPAEDYHQDYLTLHPEQPYIAYYDLPKLENLKTLFPDIFREEPVLVSENSGTN